MELLEIEGEDYMGVWLGPGGGDDGAVGDLIGDGYGGLSGGGTQRG